MKKKEPLILDVACTKEGEHKGVMDALAILSGKWKIQIITTLNCGGALQFMELQRLVKGIGAKMLSKELQDMEANLLISRTVMDTRPVTVKYELTPHGKTLDGIIGELRIWGRVHRHKVMGK